MVKITINRNAVAAIEQAARAAALATMEQLYTDLVSSETMPFDIGDMQNNQTYADASEKGAVLITGSPQARRLYYHPEYNFQQGKNANAGGKWLEPYLTGDKKDFVEVTFAGLLKGKI